MKILLDTQALILAGTSALPEASKKMFLDSENEIFFSIVSLWEMAIKKSLGKLDFKMNFTDYQDLLIQEGLHRLLLEPEHLEILSELEWHHKDPFDRTLIAQSVFEQMAIMTGDDSFKKYGCHCIWNSIRYSPGK